MDFLETEKTAAASLVTMFGESAKYLPRGGGSRDITAIINRAGINDMPGAQSHSPVTKVSVINNSSTGISSSELDTGGDKIELSIRYGQAVQQRRITQILFHSAGLMELEVR